jgi:hypothetical protein
MNKFRIAPELEYTAAAYAKRGNFDIDKYDKVTGSRTVANIRVLIGFYYFF